MTKANMNSATTVNKFTFQSITKKKEYNRRNQALTAKQIHRAGGITLKSPINRMEIKLHNTIEKTPPCTNRPIKDSKLHSIEQICMFAIPSPQRKQTV
jgi:hypothetical protein